MDLFSSVSDDIIEKASTLFKKIDSLPIDERVDAINRIRGILHEHSPFKTEPVDCVIWVKSDTVQANNYNPNNVAPPEMRLLELSILADGITQPVVSVPEPADDRQYTVIDGFHRTRVCKEVRKVRERIHGYVPITIINDTRKDMKDRMAATIRHNRARGVHGVIPMVDIVSSLIQQGWADGEIAKELGMDADEVLRFKQNSGLPALFRNHEYSKSWE